MTGFAVFRQCLLRQGLLFGQCLLAAAAALTLAGCGSTAAPAAPAAPPAGPAPSPAANPAAAGTQCGQVPASAGKQAKVVIRSGAVDCAQATQVVTQYFQKLTPAEAASPQGPGPVPVGEWTCGSGPHDPVTTCSTEDDRQVEGTLAS